MLDSTVVQQLPATEMDPAVEGASVSGLPNSAKATSSADLKGKVVRGGAVVIVGQVAKVMLRMGSLVVLARLLDPKDFGLVGMATAIIGVFSVIKDAGLSTVTVQRAAISDQQMSTLFWVNMLLGTILAALSVTIAPSLARFYHEPRVLWVTTTLALGFVFNAAAVQHSALLQRQMRFTVLTATEVVSLALGTAIGIGLALKGYSYWALVAMTLAQTAILAVCVWAATGWIPKWPSRRDDIRSMLQFGGTVSLNSLVSYATYNVEKVLLGRYWGVEALGLYGRAYQLVNLPTDLLNTSVGSVAFPALSRLQDDPVRVRAYFLKGYSLVLALTLPLTIACALFAPDVILVLLGPKWNGTATIFRLLAPTILVFALINPFAWLLFSLGMVGRSLKTALVMSPIVVIAYVVGLPYGPTGLALAYSVAMVLWIVPHVLWCIHGTMIAPRDLLKAAGRILLSAGVASIVGLTVQVACRSLSWPVLRLMLGASALAISYLWMLLIVMRQKDLYLDLLLSLTRRPAVGNSP